MSSALFVILSGCLTFGVPLVMALRELAVLRRGLDGGGWSPDRQPEPAPIPKPLPPCLLVAFQPVAKVEAVAKTRELELV